MSDPANRNSLIAAFLILFGSGLLFYLMPKIMLWIGSYSPALAGVFGAGAVLAFFLIFWLRSRYQKR